MKLFEAIAYATAREGVQILASPQLVNYLADLRAFDTPAHRHIVETMVSAGYAAQIVSSLTSDDCNTPIANVESRMVSAEGYQQPLVHYVLGCVSYALGKTATPPMPPEPQRLPEPAPQVIDRVAVGWDEPAPTEKKTYMRGSIFADDLFQLVADIDASRDELNDDLKWLNINGTDTKKPFELGPCDTGTFAGKLLILSLVDLLRIVRIAGVDFSQPSPSLYPISLYFAKCFLPEIELDLDMVSVVVPTAADVINDIVDKVDKALPEREKYFEVSTVLSSSGSNALAGRYHQLLRDFVKATIAPMQGNGGKIPQINALLAKLQQLGILKKR